MCDQLNIERRYANGNVIVDNCAYCDIYPNAFNENGLESLHIESGVDTIFISKSKPNIAPKKIIFNGPATIVMWDDGTKTVVKQSNLDDYDYEKGFAMCVVKKVFGDQYAYIRKMVDKSYEDTLTANTNKVTKCLIAKLFGKDKQ